jgi:hypothetical protein
MKVHLHVMELDIDTKKTTDAKNGVSLKMSMLMKQQETLRSALRSAEPYQSLS